MPLNPLNFPRHTGHRRTAVAALALLACLLLPSCDKLKQLLPKQPPVKTAQAPVEEEMPAQPAAGELFGPEKAAEPEAPKAEPFELNKSSMVSILLYHKFGERIPTDEMMVSMPVF